MKDEIDAVRRRRSFRREFKRQVVEETLVHGASVSGVCLRHGLNSNMVLKWRGQYLREKRSVPPDSMRPLPVSVTEESSRGSSVKSGLPGAFRGIELQVADACIQLHSEVDGEAQPRRRAIALESRRGTYR